MPVLRDGYWYRDSNFSLASVSGSGYTQMRKSKANEPHGVSICMTVSEVIEQLQFLDQDAKEELYVQVFVTPAHGPAYKLNIIGIDHVQDTNTVLVKTTEGD